MEEVKKNINNRITKDVYNEYVWWCSNNGNKAMDNKNLGKQLKRFIIGLKTIKVRISYTESNRKYIIE